MVTYKLVQLIQYHSNNLAAGLVRQVQLSERAGAYRNVPPQELHDAVCEIYRHLGTWLMNKSESDVEQRYTAIGGRRAEQNVPLSELVWVIVLTKRNLREFIEDMSFPGRLLDLEEKHELSLLLDQFFDQAIHAAVVGYEWAAEDRSLKDHPKEDRPATENQQKKAS
jgi:hypothetical protein